MCEKKRKKNDGQMNFNDDSSQTLTNVERNRDIYDRYACSRGNII